MSDQSIDIRIVSDEAVAALSILEILRNGQTVTDTEWQGLFESEGYIRLKRRDESFGAKDYDRDIKTYLSSPAVVEQWKVLCETLETWIGLDVRKPAESALAYLPDESRIKAKVYPVVKKQSNSFVYKLDTDPAIFLYLDPTINAAQLENILAHELHHVGVAASSGEPDSLSRLPAAVARLIPYLGGFMEGVAMLAAAGGPVAHPHSASNVDDRKRWDRDLTNFNQDLKILEHFFADVLSGRLTDEETTKTAMSFFGIQGPWYTVGWQMAVIVEKHFGREAVIQSIIDPRILLSRYNQALVEHNRSAVMRLTSWSQEFLDSLK